MVYNGYKMLIYSMVHHHDIVGSSYYCNGIFMYIPICYSCVDISHLNKGWGLKQAERRWRSAEDLLAAVAGDLLFGSTTVPRSARGEAKFSRHFWGL